MYKRENKRKFVHRYLKSSLKYMSIEHLMTHMFFGYRKNDKINVDLVSLTYWYVLFYFAYILPLTLLLCPFVNSNVNFWHMYQVF